METRFLAAALFLFPVLALAQEPSTVPYWYVGAGFAQAQFSTDNPAVGAQSTSGPYILVGTALTDTVSFEMSSTFGGASVGPTCGSPPSPTCATLNYPADSAEYGNLLIGFRVEFPLAQRPEWRPWIAAGYGYHNVDWSHYWYSVDGGGIYLGIGADYRMARHWDLRFGLNRSSYTLTDLYGDTDSSATTNQFEAAVVYKFN